MQDLNGVYVFNVNEREYLDRPTARLIKEFSIIEGKTWSNSFHSLRFFYWCGMPFSNGLG